MRLAAAIALAPCLAAAACALPAASLTARELSLVGAGGGAMAVVKIDPRHPDPGSVLRRRARPLRPEDADLPRLVERMSATLEATGGVGLAAPQVGVSRRAILVRHGTRPPAGAAARPFVRDYVNPILEWASPDLERDYEACLSIDGVGGLVARARRVRVSYEPVGGGPRRSLAVEGFDARILQHEIDHLAGALYVDKLAGPLLPIEEMRRKRDALRRGGPAAGRPGP